MSTPRGVDTPYEIKGLKYPSNRTSSSRWRFLCWSLVVILFQYFMIDLVTHQPSSPEDVERMFGPGKEYLLFRPRDLPPPTLAEVGAHLVLAIMAWGPMGACFISIFYRIVAVISVALGFSGPQQWPSLFGSVVDAYTIRRFWGRYWHQLLRQPFQSITKFICRDILRLPYPSGIARYGNVILVFSCSALMHACIDAKGGIGFDLTGAWACFLLQPVGIIMEDVAGSLYTKMFGERRGPTPLWVRLLGYIWVWSFLALVAPLYNFPLMRYQDPARNGAPFSVLKLLRSHLESEAS
ncbi:membrane bound O-acyl transferase family-domain-containing protein [Aspergillus pseudoustus]|uniref:Membrane bound O-acyl transferase family-domain-containing protein n=1 Tax=Aspergillus pseudoustus TaxID=1810923 RepID=A0ABR4JRP2_9EURO